MQIRPPQRPFAVVLTAQLAGSLLGGVLLAIAFYYLVGVALLGTGLGMGLLTLQVYAAIIGLALGAALGTALGSRMMQEPGHLGAAIGGAILFGLLVIILSRTVFVGQMGLLSLGLGLAAVFATMIGAVVGFNLPRFTGR